MSVVPASADYDVMARYELQWDYEKSDALTGDCNLDGVLDISDGVLMKKYLLRQCELTKEQWIAADMNRDYDLNGIDMAIMKRKLTEMNIPLTAIDLAANVKPFSVEAKEQVSQDFIDSQIDFSVELFKKCLLEDGNTLVSPYSVSQALTMTANGADKNTLKEMEQVIMGGMSIDKFNEDMSAFQKQQPNDKNCKLLTANSIWVKDSQFDVKEDFLKTNKSYYSAESYSAPFDESTVNDINLWTKKHTDDMIPKLLTQKSFDPRTIMALVNAVTFDAKWEKVFEDSWSRKDGFTAFDGSKQDMQTLSETATMKYFESDTAKGIMKNYQGGRYAFAAILPKEGISISDYVNSLTAKKFASLLGSAEYDRVNLKMPEFETEYENSEMPKQLSEMGINDAFDKYIADFTKMGKAKSGENIYISDVIHKTKIKLDRTGTKAAAATIVMMDECCSVEYSKPKELDLNRPFVYAIVDTQTNIPIFIGTLMTLK